MVDKLIEISKNWATTEVENNLRASQRLIHPHIIKCHQVFTIDQVVYSVIDYYTKGSVQDSLNRSKVPLVLKLSRTWFAQILGAVSYIHSRGKFIEL